MSTKFKSLAFYFVTLALVFFVACSGGKKDAKDSAENGSIKEGSENNEIQKPKF